MRRRKIKQTGTSHGPFRSRLARKNTKQRAAVFPFFVSLLILSGTAHAQCVQDGAYNPDEIARSTFFRTREQTKFAPNERHYPLASGATARYCFSRGCTGQLSVSWTEEEQEELRQLRAGIMVEEGAASELRFIKIAVLQMETMLYRRLKALDSQTVRRLMERTAGHYGATNSDNMTWMTAAMASNDRFDKECATYAMEATQHLLILANLGLMRHWNVTPPVYRYGIPGHWTAGLENRNTCQKYRFDLNSRASSRYQLHARGENPAALALNNPQRYSYLFPGMDGNGYGEPSAPSALGGPPAKR